jgi:hypothetical protein
MGSEADRRQTGVLRVDSNDALDVWRYRVVKQTRVARDLDSDFVARP